MVTAHTLKLRSVAGRVAAALPEVAVEIVLTGSVSRGVADELSDIEMIVVTTEPLGLSDCFEHAREAGLAELDTWGVQGTEVSRVFGYYEGVPVELTWWPRDLADAQVAGILTGDHYSAADALTNGIALRSAGLLTVWQQRLAAYPDALATARIEEAALTWGGFHPTGFLTIARPGERLALVERLLDDAERVLKVVYALNRVWPPTSKRLADRLRTLPLQPPLLAERIAEALTEPDPVKALLVMHELQADTVALAPAGPNIDRARRWLAEVVEVLRGASRT
jgi:predicted nucleotidyltransferase